MVVARTKSFPYLILSTMTSLSMDSRPSDESRVLIIYTGGTIGMLLGQSGYVPEANFLTETLRSQTRFHDPHQDSLFSVSSSVEGFREWNSGRSSPLPGTRNSGLFNHTSLPTNHPSLSVCSPRPIAQPPVNTFPTVPPSLGARRESQEVSDGVYQADLPSLVTPRSTIPGGGTGKRIRYAILEVGVTSYHWDLVLTVFFSGILYSIAVILKLTV
jgi:lysophospholipase